MNEQDQLLDAEANTPPDMKPCPFCAEPINQAARKCIHCGEYLKQDWFGFRHKTLWDFFSLLVVPITLVIIGSVFTLYQSNLELEREATRAALEDERESTRTAAAAELEATRQAAAAELQATTEANRANASTLEQYLNDMSGIFLTENLEDEDVRAVIRSRTVAIVNDLDPARNAILMSFLEEAGATDWVLSRTDLSEANLSEVDLHEADLSGADLSGADLSGADLSGADLSGADLSGANLYLTSLTEANLSGANLSRVNLGAANLSGAGLSRAYLSGAALSGADLSEADLFEAGLSGADLRGAHLSGANLSGAGLSRANLGAANLSGANLSGANLQGVDLRGVTSWTIEQLEQARLLEGAIMPDERQLGQEAFQWTEYIEGPTFEEWKAQYLAKYGGTAADIRDEIIYGPGP